MKTYKQLSVLLFLLSITFSLPAQLNNPESEAQTTISLVPDSGHLLLLSPSDTSAKTKQLLAQLKLEKIPAFQYTVTKYASAQPKDKTIEKTTPSPAAPVSSSEQKGDLLTKLFIGMLLGMIGQSMRVIVGMKKKNDTAEPHDPQRLFMSLLIGLVVGAVAGVLVIVDDPSKELQEKATLLAIIAAGYAGSDFIEGFIQKTNPAPPAPPAVPVNPVTPPVQQAQ
jgi:hypothetical protein